MSQSDSDLSNDAATGAPVFVPPPFCWSNIGVEGDATCPELNAMLHCRNCPVFARAGRELLDRPAPDGYLLQWVTLLSEPKETRVRALRQIMLFRLGSEWLAMCATAFREAMDRTEVRRIPHRTTDVLLGLVNVRGEVQICFSMARLLGIEEAPVDERKVKMSYTIYKRLAVANKEGHTWVFPVDEFYGVMELDEAEDLRPVPVTVAKSHVSFSRGMFTYEKQNVSLLDDDLVFYQLRKNHM
ncbi:MAG: chemotaxis protein CheW [Candidatus Methylacidiphilales bacterium]|nr:chemotaxis protein CheW [Candidatus Methylacidiphilales bacterium]